jgi:fido (protein-threonine AMPylation protein)
MNNLSERQLKILDIIKSTTEVSFSDVYATLSSNESERTIKRDLTSLVEQGFLITQGGGRSLTYSLLLSGRFFIPTNEILYSETEPDERKGVLKAYQLSVWEKWPTSLFSPKELKELTTLTDRYRQKTTTQTPDVKQRELERFVIELSWKSSRIEGNTYTLLDTERLLKEGVPSKRNTKEETQMILNHKEAFDFIYDTPVNQMTLGYVEKVHALLMKDLIIDFGLRKQSVGITGSNYRPLDNQYQIEEALKKLLGTINVSKSVFDKALTALIGISYIQPFVDGNKRTARLVANALLLSEGASPLSYRNVDETRYRGALLTFYEQLSIVPMKRILTEQSAFAVEHYS